MPTVFLIDCSIGMAEKVPYLSGGVETVVEKRHIISQTIELLMTNTNTLTRLESVALVLFAGCDTIKIYQHFTKSSESIIQTVQHLPVYGGYHLKSAIDFAKKYLTTAYGSQRSQKILVLTDVDHQDTVMTNSTSQMSTHVKGSSMHKNRTTISKPDFTLNDDNIGDDESDIDDEMDIDMAYQSDKDDGAQQLIELTFICLTKPSRMDRSRLEHIVEMGNCTLKNIYFLTPSKSITINEQMLTQTTEQIKKDLVNVFISVLKCGHFETQLAISPALKPVVLRGNNEIIYPSKTITINGFIELSSLRSPMAISKHILLPIQRQTRLQRSSSSTNYSIGANNTSGANSSTNSIITKKQLATKKPLPPMNSPMNSTNGNNNMNNFYYLLMISLKKEKSAALISINDEWYGAVYCQKFERKKRSSRLILSVFEPGDRIPWIPSFERLGPYAVVFPSATGTTDQQSSYRKQAWPVKHFVRSYTDSFLIWCRQNNFTSDINKFVRASAKLPEKSAFFYRELNKICRGAFVYALRGNLLQLLIQMFQRQIQLGKIKPDGVKHIQHVIQYMQRLKSQERFTDIPQLTSSASSGASVAGVPAVTTGHTT